MNMYGYPALVADTHTHTLACGHAYSTINENAQAAARAELSYLCVTEHAPAMPDGPMESFFSNLMQAVPEKIAGVRILRGVEANLVSHEGDLDLGERRLRKLEWVIASYHSVCVEPGTVAEHTRAWRRIAENPDVDVIGHSGDERYLFDLKEVIPAFARHNKIVEINAHSFQFRPGSPTNCRNIAYACMEHGVRVVCSSDAHFLTDIGAVEASLSMLRDIGFPEELILNMNRERFAQAVAQAAPPFRHK